MARRGEYTRGGKRRVTVQLTDERWAAVQRLAAADGVSASAWVRRAIEAALLARGESD